MHLCCTYEPRPYGSSVLKYFQCGNMVELHNVWFLARTHVLWAILHASGKGKPLHIRPVMSNILGLGWSIARCWLPCMHTVMFAIHRSYTWNACMLTASLKQLVVVISNLRSSNIFNRDKRTTCIETEECQEVSWKHILLSPVCMGVSLQCDIIDS